MLNNSVDKSTLKYLGEDYQYKLVKEFMEDKDCFKELAPIIDQNMFTGQYLRTYVGTMLEYFRANGDVPSYSSMSIELRQKAHTQTDIEICDGVIKKIRNTPSDGSKQTRELATKFFKQQNIIKAANEMLKLAGNGDLENYDKCEELLKNALNTGNHKDYEESRLFDGMNETLSDDFRVVIPTGIGLIDETLNGGIGKGELGCIVGPSGYGKALGVNELVLTDKGFVRMGDIKITDKVIGDDGLPHNVTGIYPQGKRQLYRVTFSDNSSVLCDIEHLWDVCIRFGDDNPYRTMSLGEILESNLSVKDFKIPFSKPVVFAEKETPSNPYTFGISINLQDIRSDSFSEHETDLYLYNSIEKRTELLNGLMDLSGMCDEDGNCSYVTKWRNNAEFVKLLVNSLGGYAFISKTNEGQYEVAIRIFDKSIKVFKFKEYNVRYDNDVCRYIDSITKDVVEDAQCISIDSPNHLYLTNDFIVTHNTTVTTSMAFSAASAKTAQNDYKGFKVMQIVFEDRIKQIQRKHFSKITQVEACNLSKKEYADHVKELLSNYKDKELIQENLVIIRLKSGEKTVEFIRDIVNEHINKGFRPDLLIIDYFECIKLTGSSAMTKWEKESNTMRKIEAMANEFNIAVWVPVQGNRDSINAELVTMDKAGGAIGKIQISHIIMSITRSLEDILENIATISILKNRAGQSGRVIDGVMFNNGTCTISTENCTDYDSGIAFNKHNDEKKKDLLKEVYNSTKS